jgi:predicted amidohydrolase
MGKVIHAAAAQIQTGYKIEENRQKIEIRLHEAAGQHCNVVLFHEGCLSGYPDRTELERVDFALLREAEAGIIALAGKLGIAVLLGSSSHRDGRYFNDVLIIDERGNLRGRYAKTWRAGEPWYAAGSGPNVFTICGVDATVIICHDLRYPELARLGVAAGARIVFIANNESGLHREDKLLGYRSMQIARATENKVYAVMSNAPADRTDFGRHNSSHGNSKIVDPLGNVLDEAGYFEERLVTALLDMEMADAAPVRRICGQDRDILKKYGDNPEYSGYTQWIREGIKLVTRF